MRDRYDIPDNANKKKHQIKVNIRSLKMQIK